MSAPRGGTMVPAVGDGVSRASKGPEHTLCKAGTGFPVLHVARCWAPHRLRFVYFAERGGFLKVGSSNNVPARMRVLEARLLAVEPGGFQHEFALHRRFAEHSIGHEWFVDAPEIRAYIAGLPVPSIPLSPATPTPPAHQPFGRCINMETAGERLGLSVPDVRAAINQGTFPVPVLKVGKQFRMWRVYEPTLERYLAGEFEAKRAAS